MFNKHLNVSGRKGLGALAIPALGYLAWRNRDKLKELLHGRFGSSESEIPSESTEAI